MAKGSLSNIQFSGKNLFFAFVVLAVVGFAVWYLRFRKESFDTHSDLQQTADLYEDAPPVEGGEVVGAPSQMLGEPVASEQIGTNEIFKPLGAEEEGNTVPADCFPKQKMLDAGDLLPADADNAWAQSNPVVPGSLNTQNFLNAGYHIGLNTVGQSLRNANMQMRSEPPNPQIKVCPWNQSTIEPDIGRKGLEIGTGC